MKTILILLAEISGLLIIFVLFLFVLNYFKIITLPNFLPKTTAPAAIYTNPGTTTNQASTPVSFTKLTNQAPDAQIKKYQARASLFSKPTPQTNPNDFISDAILSAYDTQSVQVVTADGILNLHFDQNTIFEKQPNPTSIKTSTMSAGVLPIPIPFASSQEFFKNVAFGSIMQIFYSKSDLKITKASYIESIQPIL
jgi:hypothetical protein